MSLLFRLYNTTAEAADGKSTGDEYVKFRAGLSLAIVWTAAFLVFTGFYFFFRPGTLLTGEKQVLLLQQQDSLLAGNKAINQQPNDNNAFVFVNINKKFILTRFPSDSLADEHGLDGINETAKYNSPGENENPVVIRKVKTSNKKNSYTDFSIKPVPQ